MSKKELLAPAGNFECLKMAVMAGADAVYLGGKNFGARRFASNFNDEEMIAAIKYCHLYGVKIYVTVNTIIYEDELDECVNYVEFLHKNGVDAVIVQDIGLIRILQGTFPNLEIHASTQCHTYNENQFKLLEELGVKRVVLAREMDLKSINDINTSLEKEAFIHGAICISYSGQCLFSSLIMNRSGNRGECAGMCRLPYKLEDSDSNLIETDGEYLLSPKELSTIDRFKEIMESDITSFKIEGRMKSPEYVYLVTKIYRTLIDKYNQGLELEINEDDYKKLKIIYNREFTNGHLFNRRGNYLMNIKTPNHIGINIGKVIDVNNSKITIKLTEDIYQEDGIRFTSNNKGMILNFIYDKSGKLINSAKSGDIIFVDNKVNLDETSDVLKTSSVYLNKEINKIIDKKIPVRFLVKARIGKPLEIEINDYENSVKLTDIVVDKAIKNVTDKNVLIEKLSKLGDTPFKVKSIDFDIDEDIFIPMSNLNELRRKLTNELINVRENKICEFIKNNIKFNDNYKCSSNDVKISILVNTKEQLDVVLDKYKEIISDIYVTDKDLYLEYKHLNNIYYQIPRIDNSKDIINNENILITDLSNLDKYKNNNIVSDYYLNVVNSKYINYLFDKGVSKVTLSVENSVYKIKNIIDSYQNVPNIEVIIYGKIELMIMKHCLLNNLVNKDKFPCKACDKNYYLVDRNNKKYRILTKNRTTRLLSYKDELYNSEDILKLKEMGIKNYRINLFDEDRDKTIGIIEKYKNILF